MTRTILVITGTRAEYGILKPVLLSIKKHHNLNLKLLVTGMHLSHEFGFTVNDIKADGFNIDFSVDMLLSQDTNESMVKSLAIGILGIVDVLSISKPDIVLVCGDRNEAFAGAIAASYMAIPVAHLFGGDSAQGSNIDDCIRHSISKFSHIHLTMTEEHTKRLINMGEESWRIFQVGSPAIDTILSTHFLASDIIAQKFGIKLNEPLVLLLQHPTTINNELSSTEIEQTINAIVDLKVQTVIIYPNSDPGGRDMIEVIKKYENIPNIKIIKNIPHIEFLSLLSICDVLVGNSSSGIFEAPALKVPVVNIGIRQEGRGRTNNIINVRQNREEIQMGIKKALFDKEFLNMANQIQNPFGDGHASEKIISALLNIDIDKKLLQKKITY